MLPRSMSAIVLQLSEAATSSRLFCSLPLLPGDTSHSAFTQVQVFSSDFTENQVESDC